jgi:aryl-alcohol dehydrogenase-like predicted oxidoreductase
MQLKKYPMLKPETFLDEWNMDLMNPPLDPRFQPCYLAEVIWQMKEAGLDYVDLWRISLLVDSSQHTEGEVEEAVKALEWAKKSGRARFIGFSSHDRPHLRAILRSLFHRPARSRSFMSRSHGASRPAPAGHCLPQRTG